MIEELYDELATLHAKRGRTAYDTARFMALSIAEELQERTGCEWDKIDADIQRETILAWAELLFNILVQ